jgi:hypothetical protein
MHNSIASHKTFVKSAAQQTGQTGFWPSADFHQPPNGAIMPAQEPAFAALLCVAADAKTALAGSRKKVFDRHRQIAAAYVRLSRVCA